MAIHRTRTLLAVLTLSVLALAACGGGGEPEKPVTCDPAGTTIVVLAKAGSFGVGCVAVPAGQDFTVELTNEDTFFHNFTVREGTQNVFAVGARPGDTSTVTQDAMEVGRYEFLCTLHHTMKGTFIVG